MNSNNISKGVKLSKMYVTTNAFIQVLGGIIFIALFVYLFNQYRAYMKAERRKILDDRKPSICPDYWETVGPNKCRNVHKIGKLDNVVMDFNQKQYTHKTRGKFNKKQWAKTYEIPWAGIYDGSSFKVKEHTQ